MKSSHIAIAIVAILLVAGVGVYVLSGNVDRGNNPDQGIPDSDYYPITITTSAGGTLYQQTFTKAPERIVVLYDPNIELLCYYGLEDRIVQAFAGHNGGSYTTLFPELADKHASIETMNSSTMSSELVRSLNPDLIIGWSSTFNDTFGRVTTWNDFGINCFVTNRPSASVDDYLLLLENMGKIFNMEKSAEQKISSFTSSYDAVEAKVSGLSDSERVTALVLEPGEEYNGCMTYGSSFLTGDLVTKAGGINLHDGTMNDLTAEYIASLNPDIIFMMPYGHGNLGVQGSVDYFKNDPAYASMTRNIVGFTFEELYMGGLLSETIIDRMFEAMYPS